MGPTIRIYIGMGIAVTGILLCIELIVQESRRRKKEIVDQIKRIENDSRG